MTSNITRANIVDSQQDGYESLCESCGESLQLTFFNNGREALLSTADAPVQTWLINVTLPDMSGFELYKMLRQRHPRARYLLVSDKYNANEERQARTYGASGYVCKPPQLWWLDQLIHRDRSLHRNLDDAQQLGTSNT